MAKDRKKLQHIHSSIADKQPTPQTLEVGEIAVNNAANQEFLSLKNSNNKVVRFSSDEQMITWMEKKEVMPYEGQVRGAIGPTGTKDSMGSYGITNDDLLQNKSNLIIKNNQVAAKNTKKYDKVNGAKDIYNKEVNPTSDSGLTDGAGFAIDMSRYAMIGANPSFSSLTVTDKTDLSGNTTIANGDGTGTRTGHTLTIKTTDVTANDTNWTETITNKTSTVTNETDKITTLNASATTANVSGNTLVLQEATSISAKTPTAYLSGTTLDVKETNTDITSCGRISANTNAFTVQECAAGSGKTVINQTDIKASGKTLSFDETTSISAKTPTTTLSGTNLNVTETTSDINSTNTNLTGTNLNISETNTTINSCGKVEITTDNYTLKQCSTSGGTAEFEFCNGYTVKSNAINLQQCGTAGTISIASQTQNINGGSLTVNESGNTAINVGGALTENVTGATTENHGGAVTINNTNGVTITTTGKTCMQSTTDVNIGGDANTNVGAACNGGVYSNNTSINASSTVNVNAPTTNITGNTNISGNTVIKGTTNISGNTTIGGDLIIPIPCTGITSTTVNSALCEVLGRDTITMTKTTPAATSEILATYKLFQNGSQIGEDINIPKDHLLKDVSIVYGKASGSAFTACTSTESDCHWYIKLVWNVFDPSTGHADDKTTYLLADDFIKDIDDKNPSGVAADSSYNNVAVNVWYDGKQNLVSATTTPTIHAKENIYADGNISGTNITASTAIRANNVSANTLTAATSVTTKDLSVTGNETVGGTLNVSGASTINGVLTIPSGISKKLTWTSGTFTADTTGYNGSADKVITVPTSTAHLTKSTLTIDYNTDVRSKADTSYNTEAAATVSIPGSIDHLSNYDGTNITLPHPVLVSGTVTASGAIYSSDRNLKENIDFVKREEFNKVKNIFAKSYNFKSDESKAKTYGVIAQEVQEAGLPELVKITDDKGTLGVDYTSLFVLKIAYLEDFCAMLNGRIVELENRIKELENKD